MIVGFLGCLLWRKGGRRMEGFEHRGFRGWRCGGGGGRGVRCGLGLFAADWEPTSAMEQVKRWSCAYTIFAIFLEMIERLPVI